jgi:hypothetical protein
MSAQKTSCELISRVNFGRAQPHFSGQFSTRSNSLRWQAPTKLFRPACSMCANAQICFENSRIIRIPQLLKEKERP